MTVPIALVGGLAAGVAEPASMAFGGDVQGAARVLIHNYTGFETDTGNFNAAHLANGLLPLVLGALIHKFVGGRPLNVNAALARANVPFIRI